MGNPHEYITPDVVADFTSIKVEDAGPDRVRVFGIVGKPPTDKLKVSIAYRAGFKAIGTLVYAWPDAMEKAGVADRVLRQRLDRLGLRFDEMHTEFLGANATHGALAGDGRDAPEVQLRIGVRSAERSPVERFTREIAPLVLNGPPSVTGFAGGRPKTEEVVAYWPALVDKRRDHAARGDLLAMKVRLVDIAHARSGDKGDTANVGVIAMRSEWYPLIARELTRERVARHFDGMIEGAVERYELPNLDALNFLLHGALGGGGTLSLKTDAQGKVFSTALLRMVLDVPDDEARRLNLPRGVA